MTIRYETFNPPKRYEAGSIQHLLKGTHGKVIPPGTEKLDISPITGGSKYELSVRLEEGSGNAIGDIFVTPVKPQSETGNIRFHGNSSYQFQDNIMERVEHFQPAKHTLGDNNSSKADMLVIAENKVNLKNKTQETLVYGVVIYKPGNDSK